MKLFNKIKEKVLNWASALIVGTDPLTDKEKEELNNLQEREDKYVKEILSLKCEILKLKEKLKQINNK